MATVIFSNMGDTDTAVLRYIWMGMPNVKVVEITRSTRNPIRLVNEAIEQEHDTLIMCGHGTPAGLLNPGFNGSAYLVGAHNYMKIRCNRIIGIWCHAKDFAETYGVRGFWSSMFISNKGEASSNGIYSVSDKSITEQEILFCVRLNQLINNYIPMKTWVDSLRSDADYTNPVVKFNYDGLRYYKTAPAPARRNFSSILSSESNRWGVDLCGLYDDIYGDLDEEPDTSTDAVVVPYEPKGCGGIKKTSFQDAEVIETKPEKPTKKKKPYKINTAVKDDVTGISLDEEWPSEVWGHMD